MMKPPKTRAICTPTPIKHADLSEINKIPPAENPETFTGLKLGPPMNRAAGIPAIYHSLKHVFGEAGVLRGLQALSALNQKGGFDCPSCAWPDPDDERSGIAEYCENGAKAVADEATQKKIGAEFFAKHSVAGLASLSDYDLGKKGRIAEPLYLPPGGTHYQAISWDNAFSKIGETLRSLASPHEAVFYTSGRTSNEAAFLYQLFVRTYGTNNLPDCSNMCHESSGVALSEALGIGKGSVTLEDFYEAELIIILGQNPGTNHPRMLTALQKAKARGARIISINPLPEAGLMGFNNPQTVKGWLNMDYALTNLFLPLRINGDLPLLQAIEYFLLKDEAANPGTVLDLGFIHNHTSGFEEWRAHILQKDVQALSNDCGIGIPDIREAAAMIAGSKKIIACWAMGLTQHVNAVDTIREIVNLLLMKGSIGKPGAGTCTVRGLSNVQGNRTMGIDEKPSPAFLDALEKYFSFTPPREHGYDVVDCIRAMHEGKASVFIAMGGNFLSATPDTLYTAEALRNCSLTVQVSTKLNRSHLVHGREALILPCLGRSDKDILNGETQFVSCENSMGVVQASKGMLTPVSPHLLSEPVIICRMAMATLGKDSPVHWEKYMTHYDAIRADIEQCIPGFERYNERVRQDGGFYLPNGSREGRFDTPLGKALFHIATAKPLELEDAELLMMTIRSHDQFNTTVYGLDDRYRGIRHERRVVLMNRQDMQDMGLQDRDVVDLENHDGGRRRVAKSFIVVPYAIPRKCVATYFPEANVLVPIGLVAEKSNTPVSKAVRIRIKKST